MNESAGRRVPGGVCDGSAGVTALPFFWTLRNPLDK